MRTTLFAAIAVAALALSGCKKKPTTDELIKIKDQACACPDKACADKIDKQMDKLLAGLDDKDLDEKATSVVMDIAICLAKQGVH